MLNGFFFIFFSALSFFTDIGIINELRQNIEKDLSEEYLEKCYEILSEDSNNAIQLAYLGVVEFMISKNASFPIRKFKYFNKGKEHLDDAILKDPPNIELRYLRFIFQSEIPKFLGYHENRLMDLDIFVENFQISKIEKEYKVLMLTRMKSSSNLTDEEYNVLNKLNP